MGEPSEEENDQCPTPNIKCKSKKENMSPADGKTIVQFNLVIKSVRNGVAIVTYLVIRA
jgi:hypothetical protein